MSSTRKCPKCNSTNLLPLSRNQFIGLEERVARDGIAINSSRGNQTALMITFVTSVGKYLSSKPHRCLSCRHEFRVWGDFGIT